MSGITSVGSGTTGDKRLEVELKKEIVVRPCTWVGLVKPMWDLIRHGIRAHVHEA